jgi:hypothetical protein
MNERIFVGVCATGVAYSDRKREKHGDWALLAFISYKTLALEIEKDCPAALRAEITEDAAKIQARRGEQFRVSTCGQTVTLGHN